MLDLMLIQKNLLQILVKFHRKILIYREISPSKTNAAGPVIST